MVEIIESVASQFHLKLDFVYDKKWRVDHKNGPIRI